MTRISRLAVFALTLPLVGLGCSKSDGGAGGSGKGSATGPYAEAGKLVMEAATAAVETSTKNIANEKWGVPAGDPELAEKLKPFADAKALFVVFEFEGMSDKKYLRTSAVAFPNGRLAWMSVKLRDGPASISPTRGLAAAAPALDSAWKKMMEALGGEGCKSLPTVSEGDVKMLPPEGQRAFLAAKESLASVCPLAVGGQNWEPRIDDMTVLLEKDGRLAQLRTSLQVEGGKLVLGKRRVRVMP